LKSASTLFQRYKSVIATAVQRFCNANNAISKLLKKIYSLTLKNSALQRYFNAKK
jgi:hypothetical protein